MKNPARLLFLVWIFFGFATSLPALPEPPPEATLTMRLKGTSPGYYFLVNGKEFHDTDSLKEFVAKLAAGSVLEWNSGCILFKKLPVGGPEVSVAAFRKFCAEHGVDFRYTFGW